MRTLMVVEGEPRPSSVWGYVEVPTYNARGEVDGGFLLPEGELAQSWLGYGRRLTVSPWAMADHCHASGLEQAEEA